MPALDRDHNIVKNALIKDGWTVTNEPLTLKYGKRDLFVDIGAEKLLTAECGMEKIAVEIKGFAGQSEVMELECAAGQFLLYQKLLKRL